MDLRKTRFVCISDTHNQTPKLPQGDVLIHAGDLTNQGSYSELRKTVHWIEKADFEAKIVIAGNHDITLDAPFYAQHGLYFHNQHPQSPPDCLSLLTSSPTITYLNHESATIRLERPTGPHTTFKIFGSPLSPAHGFWAFGYDRADAQGIWNAIPLDADIVVTHTPPRGHCDARTGSAPRGCEALRRALWRVRPKLAVCGHRHEGRGVERVRWRLDMPHVKFMEESCGFWTDPGRDSKKQSMVDLTSKSGNPLDNYDTAQVPRSISRVTFSQPEPELARPTAEELLSVEGIDSKANTLRRHLIPGRKKAIVRGLAERSALQGTDAGADDEELSALDERDIAALAGRTGRKETCIVNAAIMAASYGRPDHGTLNKPIVVDVDLPVWLG